MKLLDSLKGLELIISDTKTGFEVEIVDLGKPAVTILNQTILSRKESIGGQEVRRSFTPRVPFRDENADIERDFIQPSL